MMNAPLFQKNVLVFGLGILGGGVGVVKTLAQLGAKIRITDLKTEEPLAEALSELPTTQIEKITLGKHSYEDLDWAHVVIKNPAVPTTSPYIQYALAKGKHVTTEAALFLKLTQSHSIGITGTRGKTTTTMMTYEVLKDQLGERVLVGGNIRDKGCLPLLLEETAESIAVIELSSWALEGCHWEKVSPQISAITNLYPDHLNRYEGKMERYAEDKAAIVQYQGPEDIAILNQRNPWTPFFQERTHAHIRQVGDETLPEDVPLALPGAHNRLNAGYAWEIAAALELDPISVRKSLSHFRVVSYRQQLVGETPTLRFVNDSTSTTPEALLVALQTFPTATFIIGGTTKSLPLTSLAQSISRHHGKILWLTGSGTAELIAELSAMGEQGKAASLSAVAIAENLPQAFQAAIDTTHEGTIVFSPGFTSFELFANEFDRAEQFDQLVNQFLSRFK